MSKKTKAEKHLRRVAARPRRKAHTRSSLRRNPIVSPLLPLGTENKTIDFLFVRGVLRVISGLEDMGIDIIGRLGKPSDFISPVGTKGPPA